MAKYAGRQTGRKISKKVERWEERCTGKQEGGHEVWKLGSQEVRKSESQAEKKIGRRIGIGDIGGGGPHRPYI